MHARPPRALLDATPPREGEMPGDVLAYRALVLDPQRLTPLQQQVADSLLSPEVERPTAEPWAEELASRIDDALIAHAAHITGDPLFVSKGAISGVLACETAHLAPREPFQWGPLTARGEIIHRAAALAAAGADLDPHELATTALDEALSGSGSLSRWLRRQPERTRLAVVARRSPA